MGYSMLTTIDNPFDPFEQFTSWFMFDVEKGYYSCGRLARLVNLSDDMTQKEIDDEIERAIDQLIKYDPCDLYIKVQEKAGTSAT
jgi:hypothetical protein